MTPWNKLCLGGRRITPSLTCLGFPGPRGSAPLSSRAKSGALALGLIWKSGSGVPLCGLGEIGLLSERCASRNRCSPAKPIAAAGLLAPPISWRSGDGGGAQVWLDTAGGPASEWAPGSLPQVNGRASSPASSLPYSDASLFPGSTGRERPEDGTSTAHYDALNLPTASVQRGKTSAHLLVIRQ